MTNNNTELAYSGATAPGKALPHGALAVIASLALFGLFSTLFLPVWETNDDVAMSMVAHGYGIVANASPNLIFSNVAWGYIVMAMPSVGNVLGYSIATMVVITTACAAILYFLMRMGVGRIQAVLAGVLIFVWPFLFPQFTINSGLLAIAAVLGWRAYADHEDISALVISCVFAFLSYIIRSQEFWLVLAISLPILPWKKLASSRQMQVGLLLLGASILGAIAVDSAAYDGASWKAFYDFNSARAPYTDFQADAQLKGRPDILARHGYSLNDLELIHDWFFVDPKLSDPATLRAMLSEIGFRQWLQRGLGLGVEALRLLPVVQLWPMMLCGIILFIARPSRRIAMMWALFLAAVFALGALGRPGVTRVYYPLCALLVLVSMLNIRHRPKWTDDIAMLSLLLSALAAIYAVQPYQAGAKAQVARTQMQLSGMPGGTLVAWGETFPFQDAFPLFRGAIAPHSVRLYPLGVFTFAPFSVATEEEASGTGFLKRLTSEAGLNAALTPRRVELLRTYCKERLHADLDVAIAFQAEGFIVRNLKCRSAQR